MIGFTILRMYIFAVYLMPLPAVPLHVGKDTTDILGPLRADGTVDYVAALNDLAKKGVKPEDNAAVLLVKALGPTDINPDVRDAFLRELGLQGLPESGEYLTSLERFAKEHPDPAGVAPDVAQAMFAEREKVLQGPCTAADHPTVAAWIKANEKALALVSEATGKDHFYLPIVPLPLPKSRAMTSVMVPRLGGYKTMGNCLCCRAMLKLGSGDGNGAVDDMLATARLGRLIGEHPVLISGLVGMALEAMADGAISRTATSGRLTVMQLKRLQAGLASLPPRTNALSVDMTGERWYGLDGAMNLEHPDQAIAYFQVLRMTMGPPAGVGTR